MGKKKTTLRGRNKGNKHAVALNGHTYCPIGLVVFVCRNPANEKE